ncbi:MAG TPA: hypothetical protein VMT98_05275 [Verrucomicrobiae bacterium]|nr:hypothetical protein [Verrucomicrobiae bacterium]
MQHKRSGWLAAAIGLAISAVAAPAGAAPQVLAMMASSDPIPFTCNARECYALVGSFCLQRDRDVPGFGEPYEPNFTERLKISLTDSAGNISTMTASDVALKVHSHSTYTMVRVSLARSEIDRLHATAVAMQIEPGVSLIPLARAGDLDPQTPQEIALATGPMRIAASRFLDTPSVSADSARLVAALVNGLPESRTIHDDYLGAWNRVVTESVRQKTNSEVLERAEDSFRACAQYYEGSLRQCLLSHHQQLMIPENRKFWDETSGY